MSDAMRPVTNPDWEDIENIFWTLLDRES